MHLKKAAWHFFSASLASPGAMNGGGFVPIHISDLFIRSTTSLMHRSTHLKRCMCVFFAELHFDMKRGAKRAECVTYFAARSRFYMKYIFETMRALIYQNALGARER
jgi:hypothetical protein